MSIYKFIPRRLWQQFFLVFLVLMIIPLVILGTLLIHISDKTIHKTVTSDLRQIVLHATGEVLKDYQGAYTALDATASILGTLHADPWRQETALAELALEYPAFRHTCSVDLNGQPIACSDLEVVLPENMKNNLKDCRQGEGRCVSKVYVGKNHLPVMDIIVPIRRYGKIDGLLTTQYSLRGIWDVVDQIHFSPQSHAILIDQQGLILADPDKKKVLANKIFSYPQVVNDLHQGKSACSIVLNQEEKWVMSYAPIPSLGWGLVVAEPYDEVFTSVNQMYYNSSIIVLVSILLAGLVAFIIAQWLSRPIHEMIQATRRLSKGDLTVSFPIQRRDEINRLKFAFNHMTVRLKKARHMEQLSIVGKSAASIAHELKNALVLVKAFVQLLPQRHQDKAFVQEAAETIVRELDGWNSMLRNIMDFSREQVPLNLSPVDLNALVEEVTLFAKLRAGEHQVTFLVHTKEVLPLIRADEARLKQVMLNLFTNAFEATPKGGQIRVSTFAKGYSHDPVVGFEVSNTGKGLSKEELKKIFEPFFTTKDTGLGLGLAISRNIVHRHGGRLEAESEEDKEVVFRVILPVYVKETVIRNFYDIREDRRR